MIRTIYDQTDIEKVFIYTGNSTHEGVYYDCVEKIKYRIELLKFPWTVCEVTDQQVTAELFTSPKETLFIVPGAQATDLDKQLGDKMVMIREFVEAGGKYLGVCGGAYWASRRVSYKVSETVIIEKTRDLAFFNGVAKGPQRFVEYGNDKPHGVAHLTWKGSPDSFSALVMGGGSFVNAEEFEGCEVLARYKQVAKDRENAIIKCIVGKGVAILSGPHLEWDANDLNAEDLDRYFPGHKWTWIQDALQESNECRQETFGTLLRELG